MFYPIFIVASLVRFALIILRIFTGLFAAFTGDNSTLIAIAGFFLAPCTTLLYILTVHSNGELGTYWPILIIGGIIDVIAGFAPMFDEASDPMGMFKH